MASINPVESRAFVISSLKRALHGPIDVESARWPGNDRPPTIVVTDHVFADWQDPGLKESLVDEMGQEVLRIRPTRMYGVGVLYPNLTDAQEDSLAADQEIRADQVEDEAPANVIPDVNDAPHEAEEVVAVPDGGARPRSLAVSFRVPEACTNVNVTASGGRYVRLPVVIGASPFEMWRRVPVEERVVFDAGVTSKSVVMSEHLCLQIGIESRSLGDGSRLLTVYLANTTDSGGDVASQCLFQSRLSIAVSAVLPYPSAGEVGGKDDASFQLLYRKHPIYAIGHGTDARADRNGEGWEVCTEVFPVVHLQSLTPDVSNPDGQPYAVGMRDLAEMNPSAIESVTRIVDDYKDWITARRQEMASVEEPLRQAAESHLDSCQQFVDDIVAGWRLVESNPEVQRCLQWASEVMDDQRAASTAPLRDIAWERGADGGRVPIVTGLNPHNLPRSSQSYWRPFQIAFILAAIPATIDPAHPRRDLVDIIWMPTGGGKTEAYLGLSAFVILWERVRRVKSEAPVVPSVDVLMRYTLRLLTAQQVQRAAAMMCALEVLRLRYPKPLGERVFRIGAYVGRASTPNTRKDAVVLWNALNGGRGGEKSDRSFLLARCPWCGARMGSIDGAMVGYRKVPHKGAHRVVAACPASDCPFGFSGVAANPGGLPVLEIDEDIYAVPPSFLVGTIDKFAQLSWREKSRSLFGLVVKDGKVVRRANPPSLFIQDELHLISGPLGSLDGLYEVTLEQLCEYDGGSRPRIVCATATTRNFEDQVLKLYGRGEARLVPPPALDVDDSFFARVDPTKSGRIFVGVCAPGYGSNVQSQLRTIASLVHAGGSLDLVDATTDPWWTNLVFFSSRRSLGLALSAAQTGLENATYALSQISGMRVGKLTDKGTRHARRSIGQVKELTATSRDNVTELLSQLQVEKSVPGCVDLCFATSMIEVGVDVPRLGLMTIMGQPKSFSQYIQVSGRVGRTEAAPAVVVVVLSSSNVRDRSHYETFTATHQRLYSAVESVSITPFTPQALERGLAGSLTAFLRSTTQLADPTPLLGERPVHDSLEPWRARGSLLGADRAVQCVNDRADVLVRLARVAPGPTLDWDGYSPHAVRPFLVPLGAEATFDIPGRWAVPLSMRSVDSEVGVTIPRGVAPHADQPAVAVAKADEEDF
jgi:hypothetical protein